MKVIVAAVGRLKEPYLVAAEDEYKKRLRPYCTLTIHEARDEAALLAALPAGAHLYAFDERGETLTSAAFAGDIPATSSSTAAARPWCSRSAAPTATVMRCAAGRAG